MATLVRIELGGPGRQYRYAVWHTRTGKRRKRSLGHVDKVGIREARRQCAAIQADLAAKGEIEAPGGVPTLTAWLKRFTAQRDLKKSTIAEYEVTVRLLVEKFGDARLDRIGKDDAADFRAALRKRKTGPVEPDAGETSAKISESTIRKHIRNCKTLFGEARRQDLISLNPFDEQVGSPLRVDPQWRYITTAETELLLNACPSTKWKALFGLARYAGLRLMEAIHLEWSDIDHERRVLVVRNRNTRGQQTTKDKERLVPISPELHTLLLARFEDAETGESRVVGFNPGYLSGGGGKKGDSGRKVAAAIYAKAKVPKGDPFHDLRRSLATDWIGQYPITEVAKMLGNSPEVAHRYYHQVSEQTLGRIAGLEEDAKAAEIRRLTQQLERLKKEAGEEKRGDQP